MERKGNWLITYKSQNFKRMNVALSIYDRTDNQIDVDREHNIILDSIGDNMYIPYINQKRIFNDKSSRNGISIINYEVVGEEPYHFVKSDNSYYILSGLPNNESEVRIVAEIHEKNNGNNAMTIDNYLSRGLSYSIWNRYVGEYNKTCFDVEQAFKDDILSIVLSSFNIKKFVYNNRFISYVVYEGDKCKMSILVSDSYEVKTSDDFVKSSNDIESEMFPHDYVRFVNLLSIANMDRKRNGKCNIVCNDGEHIPGLFYSMGTNISYCCKDDNNLNTFLYMFDVFDNVESAVVTDYSTRLLVEDYDLSFTPMMVAKAALMKIKVERSKMKS